MFRLTLLFICSLFAAQHVLAQRDVKDSLLNMLKAGVKGEKRVDVLNDLAYQYYDYEDSIAFEYSNQALAEALKLKYDKGIKYAYTMVGLGYASKSMHQWAIVNYRRSDAVKAADADGIAVYNLTLLGNTYRDQAMFDSARACYRHAIRNFGKGEKHHLATLYKNFGQLSLKLWRNQEALKYLDSAASVLKVYPHAYSELDIWAAYGKAYQNLLQYDKSEFYYSKVCQTAQNLDDYYHQVKCLINKAHLEYRKGNFPRALKNSLGALRLIEVYLYPPQQVEVLIQVGTIYIELGEYELANKYLLEALRIAERNNLVFETARIYNELAWIYKDQGNYRLALDYTNQSRAICERIGDKYGVASSHNVRGLIFYLQKKYTEALAEHEAAKQIRLEIEHPEGVAASLFNMSLVYVDLQDIDKALSLQQEAIAIEKGIDNILSISLSYNHLARLLISKGRLNEAQQNLERSRALARQTGAKLLLRDNAGYFAELYEAKNDFRKAFEFKKLYQSLNDSIYKEASVGRLAEMQALYQLDKKDQEINLLSKEKALQESQLEVQESRLRFQFLIIIAGIAGFILISIVLYITYKNATRIRKLNKSIREQNEEIQAQSEELSESNQLLTKLNADVNEKNEEIQAQSEELTEANQTILQINKNLEDRVDERTGELKQAYKELDTFFYRSSHDFRRPLTTFMGLAEVAKITIKDQNALELFSKVNDTAHYLDKMLVKLQSISDVGGQELVYKEIFLKEIFDTVCDNFREDLHRRNIKSICEIELKETFYSYPALLRIIVENLIENSIFFSNMVDPLIHFKAYSSGGEIVIEVRDNGEGIDREYLDRIFEMYFRANERSKGNGLGLYIVKKAVEKLNGVIVVNSVKNVGTTFTISFLGKKP